jgi:putative PEP-CTERM system integral membrane protein
MKSGLSTSTNVSTILFNLFFWSFNVSLLLIIYIGFLPFIGLAFMSDTAAGQVPLNFLVPFIGLVGVPTTCTIAGFRPKVKRASLSLFQIFYGIEAPLLLLCVVRFFILRDLTAASSFLLISGLVGTITTAHWLVKGRAPNVQANLWHLIGLSLFLFTSLYGVAIALFFVIPSLQLILSAGFAIILFTVTVLPLVILLLGATSFPFGMLSVAWQGWKQNLLKATLRYGKPKANALVAAIAILWLGIFIVLQNQPQNQAFTLLKTPPQTEGDRQVLLQKSEVIRKGLLNAYLSSYRYPRSGEDKFVYQYYHDTLMLPSLLAQGIQNTFNFVTHPFQYGGTAEDRAKAEKLYAEFFDAPILRQEQSAIQKAVTSTFNRGEAKASLLDVNQKRVKLTQQDIAIKPQGDWAEVELHEVYENQTLNPEEILYYFSLPESAVVTGLWLGDTDNRATSSPFQISTRGAAQKVYTQQVVRNVDPALLEQVGPRNYRLRAFPIPAQGGGKLHLWMTYKTMKQGNNWPMPTLNEKRNVYWTNGTQHRINSKAASAQDQWLPNAVSANKVQPIAHQLTLPSGGTVLAKPFAQKDYSLPQGKRIAVVLDESYSMNAHRQEVEETFQWLAGNILSKNQVDLYQTARTPAQPQKVAGIKKFDVAKATFYGLLEPRQMLKPSAKMQPMMPSY